MVAPPSPWAAFVRRNALLIHRPGRRDRLARQMRCAIRFELGSAQTPRRTKALTRFTVPDIGDTQHKCLIARSIGLNDEAIACRDEAVAYLDEAVGRRDDSNRRARSRARRIGDRAARCLRSGRREHPMRIPVCATRMYQWGIASRVERIDRRALLSRQGRWKIVPELTAIGSAVEMSVSTLGSIGRAESGIVRLERGVDRGE
jgi:hypothetical protein